MGFWRQLKRFFIVDLTTTRDPFSLGRWERPRGDDQSEPTTMPAAFQGELEDEKLGPGLDENIVRAKGWFGLPQSQGLVIHPLTLPGKPERRAAVLYVSGVADSKRLASSVLKPLLRVTSNGQPPGSLRELFRKVLEEGQTTVRSEWGRLVNDLLDGAAVVLVDGESEAISVRIEGWAKRSIDRPKAEVTVRGPQEAFTEDLRSSISQIRRRLRTPDLQVELGRLGQVSRTEMAIVYLKGITNTRLVDEVRRRLAAVHIDYINDTGSLAQFIEDRPRSLYPTIMATERPDRVASQVSEGYVAILVDNDAHALIVPVTMPSLLHSPEDIYLRWPSGTFMRLTRVAAYYAAMMLPAVYIALANFRQEMIPTPLLLAIAHARETVPFSVVVEVLIMESSFELIHEAALRVPTVIGPTIGIVGTLILGQAAVQAGIISPILVIITAATALAAFAIPNYELQMAVRIWRFIYIAAASVFGLTGIVLAHTAYVGHLCSVRSFGVPYLSPLAPRGRTGDVLVRSPIFTLEKRPNLVRSQRSRQQEEITRPWSPSSPATQKKGDDRDRT